MMTIGVFAREYPANYTDNAFGDDCVLVNVAVRTQHPVYRDTTIAVNHWMLLSSVGKPPKILSEEDALRARANTFFSKEGLCSSIENTHP